MALIGVLAHSPSRSARYEGFDTDLVVFSPKGIDWEHGQVRGQIHSNRWSRGVCPFPQAVYNCFYPTSLAFVEKIEALTGPGKVFNRETRLDKWKVYTALSSSSLRAWVPPTVPWSQLTLIQWLSIYPGLILKPQQGSQGKGLYRIKEKDGAWFLTKHTDHGGQRFSSLQYLAETVQNLLGDRPYLIQVEIPLLRLDGRALDLRLLLQKGGTGDWLISAGMSRLARKGYYVTNFAHSLYTLEEILDELKLDLYPEISHLSLEVAKVMDDQFGTMGEMSVDLALDQRGFPWIIEVNGRPSKQLFNGLLDEDQLSRIHRLPLEYALYLAQK